MNKYTKIDDDIFVCNDCGDHADKPENVKHFKGCNPGESDKWQAYYSQPDPEDMITDEEYEAYLNTDFNES